MVALRDIFDVLFHIEGRAVLSRGIIRAVWRVVRRVAGTRPGIFALAGPLGLIAVIAAWAVLIAAGWALLLLPHLSSFRDAAGDPAQGGFLEALHISLGTLSTMGYGDVTPIEPWLRVVAPLEALIGFGLLTASVTWLFVVHPAVLRRRSLAYELWLIRHTGDVHDDAPVIGEQLLGELTSRIIAIERDLVAIPSSYYFAEQDERFSLAAELPFLRRLAHECKTDGADAGTVQRAHMLSTAIEDLLRTIARLVHGEDPLDADATLAVYAEDHLKDAPPSQ
ncbi:MAG: two pore domain potassium channel family protein [Solirubrobacterales bacterium]|nr:two pore domain potassium channel family protein [Solirubrobacterales bacterium]